MRRATVDVYWAVVGRFDLLVSTHTMAARETQAAFNHTIHEPADFPTIQAAVNAATAGDLVLIAKGVYHEAVDVKTPGITIRGEYRMGVELDGRDASGKPVLPNGI